MSNSQMEAYHNYFLTSTKVSYACQLGIQSKKASTNVIILYLANNPVTCRKNILQMKEGVSNVEETKLLQNFVSLAYLESIYSRDLELISQQCCLQTQISSAIILRSCRESLFPDCFFCPAFFPHDFQCRILMPKMSPQDRFSPGD